MHILICDDDAAFGARMAEYVAVYFTARSVQVHTAVCTSAAEVLATPGLELYQLAFLDVDMPGANGMVLGRQLKQKCPDLMLVYVSAYLEFALEGYTVNAYRYLLKRDIARTLPKCLDDLLADLPPMLYENGFLQVSRSDVVNMKYVRSIRSYRALLKNGVELSVSRAGYAAIQNAYLEWKGQYGDE